MVGGVGPGGGGGFRVGGGGGVVDYCQGVGLGCEGAVGDGGAHPVGGIWVACGLDDHVGALADLWCWFSRCSDYGCWRLAYSKGHNLGLIRLDRHKVVCNDGQLMPVNAELLYRVGTSINQPQPMLLASRELKLRKTGVVRAWRSISDKRAVVVHLPIDQIIIRSRRYISKIRTHYIFYELIVRLVIIVRQQYWAKVNVVVCALRAVDDHWSNEATGVLCAVVRMIPGRAVQVCLEAICQALARGDRTLGDSWHAVFPRGAGLE